MTSQDDKIKQYASFTSSLTSLDSEVKAKIDELADSLAKQKVHSATLTSLLSNKGVDADTLIASKLKAQDDSDQVMLKLAQFEETIQKQYKK